MELLPCRSHVFVEGSVAGGEGCVINWLYGDSSDLRDSSRLRAYIVPEGRFRGWGCSLGVSGSLQRCTKK